MSTESRWFAERELEFRQSDSAPPEKVFARVGMPEPEEDFWKCATLIEGAPTERGVFYAYGEDSLQALLLAIQAVSIRLKALSRTGALTWFGSPDLGLPEPDTAAE